MGFKWSNFVCLTGYSMQRHLGPDGTRLKTKCSNQAMKAYVTILVEWSKKIKKEKQI